MLCVYLDADVYETVFLAFVLEGWADSAKCVAGTQFVFKKLKKIVFKNICFKKYFFKVCRWYTICFNPALIYIYIIPGYFLSRKIADSAQSV